MMKVSVVILNWNGCDMLRTFLPSVVRYSEGEGVEVCVADNGSTDTSVSLLQQEFPSVRTIVLDQNYGFADGYNWALQQVDAEYVVLLNSDVEVTEHWLEPMIAYLDAHPEVAACQPNPPFAAFLYEFLAFPLRYGTARNIATTIAENIFISIVGRPSHNTN